MTPDRPGRTTATDAQSMPDDDLLEETARELSLTPPSQRLDQQILRWGGLRPKLESMGLTLGGTFTADYSKNFRGGVDTDGEAYRNLLDVRLTLDTRAAFGWQGGTFSIDFQHQNGVNGSDNLVGDVQGFTNTDSDGRDQISEMWYEQLLLDNKLRIKVGKVDANSEFALPQYGTGFINSSFGYAPTITGLPTYPDPSVSANVFIYPTRQFYAGFGVYDGSGSSGVVTGSYGPSRVFHSDRSLFYIAEVGMRWSIAENTLPGRVAVGGHYLDGDVDRFDGTSQNGAGGLYVVVEQKLIHSRFYDKTNDNGLYAFFQYGHGNSAVNEVTDYYGAGLTWIGPYTKVYADSLGIGVAAARLTDDPGAGFTEDYEVSIEAFYNYQVTAYLSVKPDLQYIIHPGGDASLRDALVATVRVTLAF